MIEFLARNRGPISLLIGGLGLFILALVPATRAVRRAGGLRAVLRHGRREAALTGAAVVRPVRMWLRYRRGLRRLTRALADPATRDTARRALGAAAAGPARPYAVLLGPAVAGVLVAGRDPGPPPPPFTADEDDPRLWWAGLEALDDPPGGGSDGGFGRDSGGEPVVLGTARRDLVVLLDLHTGPGSLAGAGDPRTTRALIQAVAAQLDRAHPGTVTVTAGVHPRFAGSAPGPATAYLVCPEPPATVPAGVRVLAVAGARGSARLVTTERGGIVRIVGVPLDIETAALPRAVARLLRSAPPVGPGPSPAQAGPPLPPGPAGPPEDFGAFAPEPTAVTGVSAAAPSTVDEFAEPAFDDAAVGRRAGGTA